MRKEIITDKVRVNGDIVRTDIPRRDRVVYEPFISIVDADKLAVVLQYLRLLVFFVSSYLLYLEVNL